MFNFLNFSHFRGLAEASVKEQGDVKEGVLGPVPHSLRGFLGRHQLLTPASTAFDQCSGCCSAASFTLASLEFMGLFVNVTDDHMLSEITMNQQYMHFKRNCFPFQNNEHQIFLP